MPDRVPGGDFDPIGFDVFSELSWERQVHAELVATLGGEPGRTIATMGGLWSPKFGLPGGRSAFVTTMSDFYASGYPERDISKDTDQRYRERLRDGTATLAVEIRHGQKRERTVRLIHPIVGRESMMGHVLHRAGLVWEKAPDEPHVVGFDQQEGFYIAPDLASVPVLAKVLESVRRQRAA